MPIKMQTSGLTDQHSQASRCLFKGYGGWSQWPGLMVQIARVWKGVFDAEGMAVFGAFEPAYKI
jgi:hypothetical protein